MKEINVLIRSDGSQVKIVAELFTSPPSFTPSVGTFVMHRESENCEWTLCKSNESKPWISCDDYIKNGRPEILKYATWGEILKTSQTLMNRYQGVM